MSAAEKSKKSDKQHIVDVQKPGTTSPSTTSRPVIVNNRPVLKDPMMLGESGDTEEKAGGPLKLSAADKPELQPLDPTLTEEKSDDEGPLADESKITENDISSEEAPFDTADTKTATDARIQESVAQESVEGTGDRAPGLGSDVMKSVPNKQEAAGNEKAEHEAAIQRLVDGKKYVLPIQTVEQRNSKRVLILGTALSVVLLLLWLNVALDAGIIRLEGIRPLTDLFPN